MSSERIALIVIGCVVALTTALANTLPQGSAWQVFFARIGVFVRSFEDVAMGKMMRKKTKASEIAKSASKMLPIISLVASAFGFAAFVDACAASPKQIESDALKIADGSCNLIEDLTNSPQVEVVCTILDAAGNAKLLRFQAKRAPTMIMKLRDAGADGDAK